MDSFVNHFFEVYNLTQVKRIPGRIVVLDRVPFKDNPMRDTSVVSRALPELPSLARTLPDQLQALVGTGVNVTVQVESMVNLTMQEQLRVVRQADVLLGNHGAGLTHGIFLDDGAIMIEMSCAHGFFPELMRWKPRVKHICDGHVRGYIPQLYWESIIWKIRQHMSPS